MKQRSVMIGLLSLLALCGALLCLRPVGATKPLLAHVSLAPHLQGGGFTPLQAIAQVSAKRLHSCVLTQSGGVKCWGLNDNGRLGDNSTTQRTSAVNVVGLSSGVSAVEVGGHHSCALLTNGQVQCWGWNKDGELGDGGNSDGLTPVTVVGLGGTVKTLALGGSHTCALLTSGAVQCWGNNNEGELGSNTMNDYRNSVATVSGLGSGVKAIVANSVHSCALLNTGSVQCWGGNYYGQLGDNTAGSANHRATPVAVVGLSSGVAQIWAGRDHNCVLMENGAVKCWGLNSSGQLGNGSTQNQSTPVDVSSLGGTVLELAGGGDHTCARLSEGSVKCWGLNDSGQLGDGTTTNRLTPVDVPNLSGVLVITAGRRHTCAFLNNNQVKCWGLNDNGQVGDGSATTRKTPVYVVEAAASLPALTVASITVNESASDALLTVNLSSASSSAVTVNYATSNGTATASSDYTAASGTLTFNPGETSKNISIVLLNDPLDEANETLNLTLSSPSNATLGTPSTATITLTDDDLPPTAQFSLSSVSLAENAGTALIQVTLSAAAGRSVTVNYSTSNSTATAGSDYTATNNTLTFASGETSKTFAVAVLNDSLDEADETLNLTLSSPTNASLGAPAAATLTISDDDPLPTIQFSSASYSVNENAGAALITINLAQPSGRTLTVEYATSNNSASAGSDYTASSSTLAFTPGETSQNFNVPILDDNVIEANETVNLSLRNPANATLGGTTSATLTILNDDGGAPVTPTVNFVATPQNGLAPLTVKFTDQSTGSINTWLWNFGDGATSTEQHPTHTYLSPGDFTVMLTVSGAGGSANKTQPSYIHVTTPSAPEANFTADLSSGFRPLTVRFTDQSSGNPTSWLWSFGDGTTSTEQHPTHSYNSAGDFTVTLSVTAPGGQDTTSSINYIRVNETPQVAADFAANPLVGEQPLTVRFTDLSTGTLTSWLWRFGDHSISSEPNPQHSYNTAGVYTVTLTVAGPHGAATITKTNYIRVTLPPTAPTADFSATPLTGTAPLDVNFSDRSQGTVTGWLWIFGDGGTSDLQNPTHSYTEPGDYTVSLTVIGPLGLDPESRARYIHVVAPQLPGTPMLDNLVTASNNSLTIAWSPGSGAVTYELQEQWNSGDWHTIYNGPAFNYSVSDRQAGEWCYRARSHNAAGASDWSTPQCLTIGLAAVYLPLTSNFPATPPPPANPTWERVGQGQLEVTALAIDADLLFAGDRRAPPNGGLYRRNLAACSSLPPLTRVSPVATNVLSVAFQASRGIVGGDDSVFYSSNNGQSWTPRPVRSKIRIATFALTSDALYAGAESGGIFRSSNEGINWTDLTATVTNINSLYFHDATLWIGTEKSGVWALPPGSDDPIESGAGLESDAQRQVWDFVFTGNNQSFIATYDGVYQRHGDSDWQAFGLAGNRVRSLAVVDQSLYAGGLSLGVWQRPLDGSQDWQRATAAGWDTAYTVRDLLYAPACQGLLAATNDGIWIYR